MAEEGGFPILALPAGIDVPPLAKPPPRGGASNPSKERQVQRLESQFLELRAVLDAHNAELTSSAFGAAPEHVLVFETNGPPDEFFAEVSRHQELEWLLDYEDRVAPDEDVKKPPKKKKKAAARKTMRPRKSTSMIARYVYMVMFNQRALEQLLSNWILYKTNRTMPSGLGAWSAVFRCLRAIRRWGPEDRLREAGILRDALEGALPDRMIPVEIELWPRSLERRTLAENRLRSAVEDCGGSVLDTVALPAIHYHAMLVQLPHPQVAELFAEEVQWLQIDDIYLVRPTQQGAWSVDSGQLVEGPATSRGATEGDPVVALLDGLPMENHPQLRGHLIVDDPDGWAATYQVHERKHGTAMASLIVHGDQDRVDVPMRRPIYVRPILNPQPDGHGGTVEIAPKGRLWLDVIHQAIRRIVASDVPNGPVAPSVKIINLSVGDPGRPFLNEPSPLARLLDWLSWKHQVLIIVSAGNHGADLPPECDDDAALLRHVFASTSHRRLLSPAEAVNVLTVGALNSDSAKVPIPANATAIPSLPDLPAAYSGLGRGLRRSVKPDVLMPGGRQLYRPTIPMAGASWTSVARQDVGHLVAVPGPPGRRSTTRLSGTSNAAALTSRLGGLFIETIEDVISRSEQDSPIEQVPTALLAKTLLVHTAEWQSDALAFVKQSLEEHLEPSRAKDQLAGLLGYGALRGDRGLGCSPDRATAIGGGRIAKNKRVRHGVPIPPALHLYTGMRRVTVTLSWFTPINPGNRKYRVARLGLDLPDEKSSPLRVKASQVHSDATTRGTVQHVILERPGTAMNVGPDEDFEIYVTCAEDGGHFEHAIPYALAVSLEVAPGTGLPVYQQVAERLLPRVVVRA